MNRLYRVCCITFWTLFCCGLVAALGHSLMQQIAKPPTFSEFLLACAIGLGMGAWYWLSHRHLPVAIIQCVDGGTISRYDNGTMVHQYPDGCIVRVRADGTCESFDV